MSPTRVVLLVVVAAVVAACAPSSPPAATDTAADVAALKAMQDRELAMIGSGNVDSALAVFTPDVVFMPPNEAIVVGSDAARKWLTDFMNGFAVSGKYTSADVTVNGDLAVVRYTGELTATPKTAGGKPTTEAVKGVHVYKRQAGGSWKIAQDVWNTDAASAPPPPPAKSKTR